MIDLNTLRLNLTRGQRKILDKIWSYQPTDFNDYIPSRIIYHKFGKTETQSALQQLGGSIVSQYYDTQKRQHCYLLTFLGTLLTSQGEEIETLLIMYLEYIRDQYRKYPELDKVESEKLQLNLSLDDRQTALLCRLVSISSINGGGAFGNPSWYAHPPNDVDEYPNINNFREYLRTLAFKNYDSELPVNQEDLHRYHATKNLKEEVNSDFSFIITPRIKQILSSDWHEAQRVYGVEAWKSCVILCGSILEGMLIDALQRDEVNAKGEYAKLKVQEGYNTKKPLPLHRWDLIDLVNVAQAMKILSEGSIHISHGVRAFRNLVHPGKQLRDKENVTKEQAEIAMNAVRMCIEQLQALNNFS